MSTSFDSVMAVAGNLIFFPEKKSASEVEDVLNTCLLMELIASRDVSKFSDLSAWRWTYFNKATELSWQVGANYYSEDPPSSAKPFSLWDRIRAAAPAFADIAEITKGEGTARLSFAAHPDQTGIQSFADNVLQDDSKGVGEKVSGPKEACLLLSFVGTGAKVICVQVRFTASRPLNSGFLFEEFTARDFVGNITIYFKSMVLDVFKYSKLREMVKVKLEGKRSSLVYELS